MENGDFMRKLISIAVFLSLALSGICTSAYSPLIWADNDPDSASEQNNPPFPATVTYRKAELGSGYVLVINTTIKQDFPAFLVIHSVGLGTTKRYQLNLSWKHATEFGHMQGAAVYPGDEITLENNQYKPLRVVLSQ
jgi:hypothetical protein